MTTGPIHEVTCVRGESFVVSGPDGDVAPDSDQGLYVRDTRFLSGIQLSVAGGAVVPLHGGVTGPGTATFHGVVRVTGSREVDPTVLLVRRRVVDGGLHEDVVVSNHGREAVALGITVALSTDFAYIFDVKQGRARPRVPATVEDGLVFRRPGSEHRVHVRGTPAPRATDGALSWDLTVEPHGIARVCLDVDVRDVYGTTPPGRRCEAFERGAAPPQHPVRAPTVDSSDRRLRRLHERGVEDLADLQVADPQAPGDRFAAAGSPWFLTLFGRDSLWAALMALTVDPDLAGGTLRVLARRQGLREDPETEEAPGKILHEVRRGSLTHLGDLPPNYYGSVDATPLFVLVLAEAWRFGLPTAEVEALLPHAEAALRWVREAAGEDGLLAYRHPEGRGLVNQGWKDSRDGIQFADGTLARPPIALAEVQAYAHAASLRGAALLEAFGHAGAAEARAFADGLRERFRARFWVEDGAGPYPAVALDGEGRTVDAIASNMGHLLLGDLLTPDEQASVAARLSDPTMDAGWGLRTMASTSGGFNPLGYHTGSVWPHDTAIVVWGLARTGHRDAAVALMDGLLRAAPHYAYRLPELLGGVGRSATAYPVPYPVACRPQAWAAGAGPLLLRACLGLEPDVPNGRVRLRPLWPPPFASLEVRDVPLGAGRLSVRVTGDDVDVTVTGAQLDVEVDAPTGSP